MYDFILEKGKVYFLFLGEEMEKRSKQIRNIETTTTTVLILKSMSFIAMKYVALCV